MNAPVHQWLIKFSDCGAVRHVTDCIDDYNNYYYTDMIVDVLINALRSEPALYCFISHLASAEDTPLPGDAADELKKQMDAAKEQPGGGEAELQATSSGRGNC